MKLHSLVNLTRINKPIGIYLLLFPCLFAIGFAAEGNISDYKMQIILFTIGAVIMRSSGCVINDLWDVKFDRQVERTKNRPLASGEVTIQTAILLFIFLSLAGLWVLLQLKYKTIILGFIFFIPVILYPLAKRFMKMPQIFLALTFNAGALLAYVEITNKITIESVLLYIACFFWTLGYDTIYAHQDKKDDIKIGVNSSAITLGSKTKTHLYIYYSIMIFLFWQLGIITLKSQIYFLFLFLASIHAFWQIYFVKLDTPSECLKKFKSNQIFGLIMLIAVLF
jgi:4-hydroxybenzoate polyprenyltransferase